MKLGLFWLCPVGAEIRLAVARYAALGAEDGPWERVICYARAPEAGMHALARGADAYPYETINDLLDVHRAAQAEGLDFALVSFGNGIPVSPTRLHGLLASAPLRRCVWSFRIGAISGAGLRHPPRLPYVDDHFIILNLERARVSGFFGRKLIHGSHFACAGGRHAHLSSMIEYSVGKDELSNHFVPDAGRDRYGLEAGLNPVPFHACEATGFVTCYSRFQPALLSLLERNLRRPAEQAPPAGFRYIARDGHWYLRPILNLKPFVRAVHRRLFDIRRHEFQKRWDQEPKK